MADVAAGAALGCGEGQPDHGGEVAMNGRVLSRADFGVSAIHGAVKAKAEKLRRKVRRVFMVRIERGAFNGCVIRDA